MATVLESLTAEVENNTRVDEAAIQLLNNLGQTLAEVQAELAAQGANSAKLDELRTTLAASSDKLAAAVLANTPAAPPAA